MITAGGRRRRACLRLVPLVADLRVAFEARLDLLRGHSIFVAGHSANEYRPHGGGKFCEIDYIGSRTPDGGSYELLEVTLSVRPPAPASKTLCGAAVSAATKIFTVADKR